MPKPPSLLDRILNQYPRLQGPDWAVLDKRGKEQKGPGKLEFYPPAEARNPMPGRPTIEVFDPSLEGEHLQRAVFGDMLHYLPTVDPRWEKFRQEFRKTLTPMQTDVDRRAYERAQREHGENRPYSKWFDISRLDAYLRGYLAPDEQNEWANIYTPRQRELLDMMRHYLESY